MAEGAPHQFDSTHILIDTDRAGTLDIFLAQRGSPTATWDVPVRVDEVSSTSSEGNPMLASSQLTIYFDSNRNGDGELFVATRTSASATFGTPAPIAETSTPFDETDPWISPDGRTLYFTSNRDGTQRLWQTTR
jgi:Tol biopolymer transport system component